MGLSRNTMTIKMGTIKALGATKVQGVTRAMEVKGPGAKILPIKGPGAKILTVKAPGVKILTVQVPGVKILTVKVPPGVVKTPTPTVLGVMMEKTPEFLPDSRLVWV